MSKPNRLITPLATVIGFVNILKPDTKFNPEGDYKIKVGIPMDQAGELIEAIQGAAAEARAEFLKNPKNKPAIMKAGGPAKYKEAGLPYYEDTELGLVVFSFKSKATYLDKTTGETKQRVIPIFGGKGRIDPKKVPQFGSGSTVKVAYQVSGFANAALGSGASLRIDSVKLFEVKAFGGGGSFGDDEEGGYAPDESQGDGGDYGGEGAATDDTPTDF